MTNVKGDILVMDDDNSFCEVMKQILTELNYSSTFVNSGKEAIRTYNESLEKKKPFDLVILDLKMDRGIDGEETANRLLQINPKIKIVISSGFSNIPIITDYKKHGIKAVLLKPYNMNKLKKLLNEII